MRWSRISAGIREQQRPEELEKKTLILQERAGWEGFLGGKGPPVDGEGWEECGRQRWRRKTCTDGGNCSKRACKDHMSHPSHLRKTLGTELL